ncbi:MAG TPA: hypothetical protein VIQ31_15925, partial [Phormidium sp.]
HQSTNRLAITINASVEVAAKPACITQSIEKSITVLTSVSTNFIAAAALSSILLVESNKEAERMIEAKTDI